MFYLTSKFHDHRVNTFGFMEEPGTGVLERTYRTEERKKEKNKQTNRCEEDQEIYNGEGEAERKIPRIRSETNQYCG